MEAAEKLLGKDDLFDPEEHNEGDWMLKSRWPWNAMDKKKFEKTYGRFEVIDLYHDLFHDLFHDPS